MKNFGMLLAEISGKVYGVGFTMIVFAAFLPVAAASWAGKVLLGVVGFFLLVVAQRLKKAISEDASV